jgi:hypothetical protein
MAIQSRRKRGGNIFEVCLTVNVIIAVVVVRQGWRSTKCRHFRVNTHRREQMERNFI